MKNFSRIFVRGVFTLLPFGVTVFILFSFFEFVDDASRKLFSRVASDFYFPGLGLIIGIVLIYSLGLITTLPFTKIVIKAFELPFRNVPIIKSVYGAAKSLADFFSSAGESSAQQQVVIVKVPGLEVELMGFITRRHLNDLPLEVTKDDRVAVFLPLSYQIGGLTVFIPRSWTKPTDMKVQVAMQSALTAWMPGRETK